MLRIGRHNTLEVLRESRHGLVLGDQDEEVLLPNSLVPSPEPRVGDELRVFVYTDSEDRPVATTQTPHASVGDVAYLEVVDVMEHGAFLDWGLDKDLFAPRTEQYRPMRVGQWHVVAVMLDERTNRVMAAGKLGKYFDYDVQEMEPGDEVDLLVYAFNDLGTLVVVDGRHAGLVYDSESHRRLRIGDELKGYVKQVRKDNKLDIQLQRQGRAGIDDAREAVLATLHAEGGWLPLHDRSSPAEISRTLDMSKKAFKRAIGGLYRERQIELLDDGIRLLRSHPARD